MKGEGLRRSSPCKWHRPHPPGKQPVREMTPSCPDLSSNPGACQCYQGSRSRYDARCEVWMCAGVYRDARLTSGPTVEDGSGGQAMATGHVDTAPPSCACEQENVGSCLGTLCNRGEDSLRWPLISACFRPLFLWSERETKSTMRSGTDWTCPQEAMGANNPASLPLKRFSSAGW